MAPGSLRKRKADMASIAINASTSSFPKRMSIIDEPIKRPPCPMASSSQQRGKNKEIAYLKGTSLLRTQTLLSARMDVPCEEEVQPNVIAQSRQGTERGGSSRDFQSKKKGSSSCTNPSISPPHEGANSNSTPELDDDARGESLDEENAEPMDENEPILQEKRVRGCTRGVELHKRNERVKKKLEVYIDPFYGRPKDRDQCNKYTNELGQVAANYIWPIDKTKDKAKVLLVVLLHLQVKLIIVNVEVPSVRESIWEHFIKLVKNRRYNLHVEFKKLVKERKAPEENKPDGVHDDIWHNLCDYWNDDDVKKICSQNKENRGKQKHGHNQGPVSFIVLFHEMLEKEGDENFNWIEFFKRARTSISGVWKNTESEQLYLEMKAMYESSKDTDEPLDPMEVLHKLYKSKSGYSSYWKGVGYGPKPPSVKKSRIDSENAHLREMNQRLAEENARLEAKQAEFDKRQAEYEQRQAESEIKQAKFEKQQAEAAARQEVLEKFMQRMIENGLDNSNT